ncbi:MAG: flagellar basal body rod protein FlgC [Verrucomicrobiota bacterium]|nr:flagellar basal body rod protein FlgC [Verrucomicrobiota bacterium]
MSMINFIPGIQSSSSALTAERIRMDVVSQNIANAHITRGLDGKPYQRQQVVFESVLADQQAGMSGGAQTVQVARIQKDESPPHMIFNPTHPDADPNGMVAMPNVNMHQEWADYITSSRAYEANVAVIKNARSMALQTLSIGKR